MRHSLSMCAVIAARDDELASVHVYDDAGEQVLQIAQFPCTRTQKCSNDKQTTKTHE
jgi:hypothetical protein